MTSRGVVEAQRLPMLPLRIAALGGLVLALALAGWQIGRVLADQQRLSVLAWGAFVAAVVGVLGLLAWTWVVVENARRLLAPKLGQEPPSPSAHVFGWLPALVVAAGAVFAVTMLQYRLVRPEEDTTSAVPLAVAAGAMLVTLLVAQRPLAMISSVMRRLGGPSIDLMRLVWVPVALAIVGAGSLLAMRAGGLFGEDYTGIAPAWALGVVMILPLVLTVGGAWSGAVACEHTVQFAFDRRNGVVRTGVGQGRISWVTRVIRADGTAIVRDRTKRIRLVPGSDLLRLALFVGLAAITLVAIVAALVMTLFWRESSDGPLLPAQVERAWDVLEQLQNLQWLIALGLLAIVTLWAFVDVLNVRLATGRRRNPVLAAAAWPAAVAGIWWIADRTVDGDAVERVAGFGAQIVVLYVPFFLLERSAMAVKAHRRPLRLTFALGSVLLVQSQGLTGLSTLDVAAASDDYGRVAGYLAMSAVLYLLTALSASESSRLIADGARDDADEHNAIVTSRLPTDGSVIPDDAREAIVEDLIVDVPASPSTAPPPAPGAGVVIAASSPPPPPPPPAPPTS